MEMKCYTTGMKLTVFLSFFLSVFQSFSLVRVQKGGESLSGRHGRRAGQRRAWSRRRGQRGLAEALHRSGDAAAEVPAPGGENPRAAGREGRRERKEEQHGSDGDHRLSLKFPPPPLHT